MNVFKSPGVDLNDMGFMRQADYPLNVLWTGYSFTEPFSIFRSLYLNNDVYLVSNYGGEITVIGYEYNLVWSQTREYSDPSGMFEVWDNVDQLFSSKQSNNTFLLKVSYRIGVR